MRLIVDTNRYRDFCAGLPEAVLPVRQAERIYLPFVVLAELRAGFAAGTHGRENERVLGLFLNRRRVAPLFADEETTFHFARLYGQLRQQGTPIPTHDIWIAALASQHGAVLCTRDEHFRHLPQVPRT
jgi:tRNA(fMet)-specific endonuclease VapC